MAALTSAQVAFLNQAVGALSYPYAWYQDAGPGVHSMLLGDNVSALETTVASLSTGTGLKFSAVNTALAAANASIAVNSQKITGMLDGVATSDAATKGQVDLVFAACAVRRGQTITLADCQAAANGVKTLARTTVLPADARIITALYSLTYFDNAGDTGVISLVSGGTTVNGLLNLTDVSTGGSGGSATKIACTGAQVIPWLSFSGQTITTTLTSDVDLNTLDKGSFSLDIFYVVLA